MYTIHFIAWSVFQHTIRLESIFLPLPLLLLPFISMSIYLTWYKWMALMSQWISLLSRPLQGFFHLNSNIIWCFKNSWDQKKNCLYTANQLKTEYISAVLDDNWVTSIMRKFQFFTLYFHQFSAMKQFSNWINAHQYISRATIEMRRCRRHNHHCHQY